MKGFKATQPVTLPLYVIIMAGGSGTRLWPLSRKSSPKQTLNLIGERSMFQLAVDRLTPILAPDHILVVTTDGLADVLAEQAPELPACNIVVEPEGRGTAPVIALGALYAEWLAGGEAVIACLTADHYIRDVECFQSVVQAAARVAESGAIVTLGIEPTFPATGYGYIQRGALHSTVGEFLVYEARKFKEKPPAGLAARFVADGQHAWNSGMFIWTTTRVREEFERQLPDTARLLQQVGAALGTPEQDEILAQIWPSLIQQTIDHGIMERAADVCVIPVELGWSDVGSWASLFEIAQADEHGNVVLSGDHWSIDTQNTLVHAQRLVATVGLENTIIVDTQDVLLVCSTDRAQDVRQVVEQLRQHQQDGNSHL